jgi:hypothetical protein
MTSEEISLSSRLWDVIVALCDEYPTVDDVKGAFPKLKDAHTLAFWGDLVSTGDDGSRALMEHLVGDSLVRASLTTSGRLGESCALHVEVVASHGRPPPPPPPHTLRSYSLLHVLALVMVRC